MSRLVDYFVICGYDHTDGGRGRVLQRFPACDREDVSFIHGLDLFCQPSGWVLAPDRQETKFFMPILTVSEGDRRRGGAAKFGFISITYHKYILGVYKYILRPEISIFDRKKR